MLCGSSMACAALAAPGVGGFAAGGVLLPAFCPSWTRSFVALSRQQRQAGGRELRTASSTSPLITPSSVLRAKRRRRTELRCGLTRLSADAGHKVLPALATRDQWTHFWGGSDVQRVGKFFEVSAVAFLGLWGCYFTSFFLGVGTMSLIGAAFLFYWLLGPNVTAFRRNRALRGRIAPVPGGIGNSIAIFSARVVSATEEYHPITGQPVFLRMVVEDEDGRALKFRTRTRAEYARVRPGMVAEAVLVSPDENFEEIVGVSDTFVPAANVWVGEYPYLEKVVMERLLASRDSRRRRRGGGEDDDYEENEQEDLQPMAYRDAWTQPREWGGAERASRPAPAGSSPTGSSVSSDYDYEYDGRDEDGDHPQYEGWGSSGFSSAKSDVSVGSGGGDAGRRGQQWERVSGTPKPRRRPAARRFEEDDDSYGDRRMREASRGRNDRREDGSEWGGGRDDVGRSSMAPGRERGRS